MSTPYPPQPEPQPDPAQPDPQQPYPAAPAYGAPAPGAPAYGAPGQQPYPGGYAPYGGAPAAPGKGLAIAGLITAIVPCTTLIGLVISIIVLVKASRGTAAGKGMAIGGIVAFVLWTVAGVLVFALGMGTLIETCSELGNGTHYVDGVTYTCNF
ncbi:hypothetical protein [Cellulomonas triticagri]|uniref:DUF4190 domain-containing protein n=1 Tax=Cellulomonas triticagri TaxID=2483352 RepID=A0A3M2JH71_9CELL|nr:hypothetical protein [Cellulomonas triticagri]RMI09628.1 hypothetical protein EBM89_09585 [Cellulomonas triticagri]